MRPSVKSILIAAVVCCVLAGAGAASDGDPASAVPADALGYAELRGDALEQSLALAAAPPAIKLALPQTESRFWYVERLLHLPTGTVDDAAPHLGCVAFAVVDELPAFLLAFDDAKWPGALLQGAEKQGNGTARLGAVSAAARDRFLVLGREKTCLRLLQGDYAALADDADFKAARAEAAETPLWGYAAVPRLLALGRKTMGKHDAEALDAFASISGASAARGAIVTSTPGPAGELTLSVLLKGEGRGVLGLLPEKPASAGLVPAGSAAALNLTWGDAAAFLGGVRDLVVEADAKWGEGTFPDILAAQEMQWEVKLDELLAQIGPGLAVYLPPGGEDHMIAREEVTAALALKDPAGFKDAFARLAMGMTGQALMPVNEGGVERLGMLPVFLKFMDDRLVIAGSPDAVKAHADWLGGAGGGNEAEWVPRAAASLWGDLGLLTLSYPAPQSSSKLVVTLARDGDKVVLAAGWRDVDAVALWQAYMKGYGAVMAAMLMPAVHGARQAARKASSMANMRVIGLDIMLYLADHDQLPPDFETLIEGGYAESPEEFLDPADAHPVQRGKKGYRYSYEIVGSLPAMPDVSSIVAYSRKGVFPDGRTVLFADSHVEFLTEAELHSREAGSHASLYASYQGLIEQFGDQLTEERKAELKRFYEVE